MLCLRTYTQVKVASGSHYCFLLKLQSHAGNIGTSISCQWLDSLNCHPHGDYDELIDNLIGDEWVRYVVNFNRVNNRAKPSTILFSSPQSVRNIKPPAHGTFHSQKLEPAIKFQIKSSINQFCAPNPFARLELFSLARCLSASINQELWNRIIRLAIFYLCFFSVKYHVE